MQNIVLTGSTGNENYESFDSEHVPEVGSIIKTNYPDLKNAWYKVKQVVTRQGTGKPRSVFCIVQKGLAL